MDYFTNYQDSILNHFEKGKTHFWEQREHGNAPKEKDFAYTHKSHVEGLDNVLDNVLEFYKEIHLQIRQ